MIIKILVLICFFILNNCVYKRYYGAGVFNKPIEYKHPKLPNNPDNTNEQKIARIEILKNEKMEFDYIGNCGASIEFIGIIIPFIPYFKSNTCEIDVFRIIRGTSINDDKNYVINYQLKYNNIIYDPLPNKTNIFKILNFKEFKKAKDKTLIIHKENEDGTIITKEIPFEWKIVSHSVVIP